LGGPGVPERGGPRSWPAAAPGKGSKDRPRPVLRQLGQLLLHLSERRVGHRRSVGKGQRRDRLVPTVDLHHEVRSLRILHDVHLGARDPFTGQLAFEPLAVPAPGGGVHRELLGAAVRHLAHVFLVCDRGFGRSPFSTPGGSNRFPWWRDTPWDAAQGQLVRVCVGSVPPRRHRRGKKKGAYSVTAVSWETVAPKQSHRP